MRRIDRILLGCAATGIACTGLAAAAASETVWWTAHTDDQWFHQSNWIGGDTHVPVFPSAQTPTYVTTSENMGSGPLPPARIPSGGLVRSGQLYVGGWLPELNTHQGDPRGQSGALDIRGQLHIASKHYMRVGTAGAAGFVFQTGGLVRSDWPITLAWYAEDSLGYWLLDAGRIEARLWIGVHGRGVLDMRSGEVAGCAGCSMEIGRGGPGPDGGLLPARGELLQSGGRFEASRLTLGKWPGASGTVALAAGGVLRVNVELIVGSGGNGSVDLRGGRLEVGSRIRLAESAGALGQLTIRGGALVQESEIVHGGWRGGLYLGEGGAAHLHVTSADAAIELAGNYVQWPAAVWSVELQREAPHVSPIRVGRHAVFAEGAVLRVALGDGFTPARGQRFALLEAELGVVADGLVLDAGREWRLDRSDPRRVSLVYVGHGL